VDAGAHSRVLPGYGSCQGAWIANAGDGYQPYTSAAMEKFYPLIEQHGYLIDFFGVMLGTTGILSRVRPSSWLLAYWLSRVTSTSGTPYCLASLEPSSATRSVTGWAKRGDDRSS
jgi:hypothetical protein